jgi:rhamnose utilization protein RhaD (predicted bifunctional aldolase and dehydrogenase)
MKPPAYGATVKRQSSEIISSLLSLSRELGREDRGLAILGEGNSSARLSADTFLIKASGSSLGRLRVGDLVECRFKVILDLLEKDRPTDGEIEAALLASRTDTRAKKPSVESLFHAYLLTLAGIGFVGHTHAIAVNSILCSDRAREFAEKRIFPDEIVCCGGQSVFVKYTDPGFRLAREIRKRTEAFIRRHEYPPRVILLENHGIITTGRTPEAVLAAMLMAEKAAEIWTGAATVGGPRFLSPENVHRIAHRVDEHYRQRALKL